MISAFNQFWGVYGELEKRTQTIIGLYFYLVKQWNDCGRALQFRHQNATICDELNISKPTLIAGRNQLKQMGLIDFHSKGKGDPTITYQILEVKQEVKKLNDFTSHFTSHFTTDFTYKQSIYFYNKAGAKEVKSFDYLKGLLLADESIKMKWVNYGYRLEQLDKAIDSFLIIKEGKEYKDFFDFRNNFFYWIPNYAKELKSISDTKQSVVEKPSNNFNPALKNKLN